MSRMIRTIVGASVGLAAVASVVGCGYASGDGRGYEWGGLYRSDIRTVAVPIFETRSFSRGDENALTQAIVNQIESRTPYKVVEASRADTIIEGQVVNALAASVSSDTHTSIPQEQLYVVQIDFTWKDLRNGKVLAERRNFEQSTAYYPTLGEGRTAGRQQAIEQLAAAIVDEMQRDW
jgi:Lipopolysaccharide-assembly